MPETIEAAALASVLRAELARRRLLDFARLVYPGFEAPPHIAMLADLLERIERGEIRKLMINIPVRHGKSTTASQALPAWYLGRHPERDVILASHSEDLAVRNSRVAKSLTQDDRWPFDVRLASDSTSVQRWNTTARGGCYAIGVGGAITGRGANLLIVDDALHDGLSETESAAAYVWFTDVAVPRLEPGAAVIMIGARFGESDLCGQILESEDGPNWHVVNLPAIAGENDPLGRAPGEALWPERFSLAELEDRRIAMGGRSFEAQFQQNPLSEKAGTFKAAWMTRRYGELYELDGVRARFMVVQAIDGAWKTGVSNDWSVIATWATDGVDYYLLDVWRAKVEFYDLKRHVVEQYRKHNPHAVVCEEAASGLALLSELRNTTGLPIIGRAPKGSKQARAEAAATPLFEAGKVVLPARAPWLDEWIREHVRFPSGAHDDQVDTTSLALVELRNAATRSLRPRPNFAGFFSR